MVNVSINQALSMAQVMGATLLDVQLEEDYRQKQLQGNVHIPLEKIMSYAPMLLPNKQAFIIVYCQRGIRSRAACDLLTRMGYQNIYNIANGIDNEW